MSILKREEIKIGLKGISSNLTGFNVVINTEEDLVSARVVASKALEYIETLEAELERAKQSKEQIKSQMYSMLYSNDSPQGVYTGYKQYLLHSGEIHTVELSRGEAASELKVLRIINNLNKNNSVSVYGRVYFLDEDTLLKQEKQD